MEIDQRALEELTKDGGILQQAIAANENGKAGYRVNVTQNFYVVRDENRGLQGFEQLSQLMVAQALLQSFQGPLLGAPEEKPTLQIEGEVAEPQVEKESKVVTGKLGGGQVEDAEYEMVEEPTFDDVLQAEARRRILVLDTHFPNVYDGKKYFESIELDYDVDWKSMVRTAQFQVPFLIVTLKRKIMETSNNREYEVEKRYTTLYSCSTRFAKVLVSPRKTERSTMIPLDFPQQYFISAVQETRRLNDDKPFYYIEELSTEGLEEDELILGGDNPRTEVYSIDSIFPFKPARTYSNFRPFVFQIDYREESKDSAAGFKITTGRL